jgi:hypothetical protein
VATQKPIDSKTLPKAPKDTGAENEGEKAITLLQDQLDELEKQHHTQKVEQNQRMSHLDMDIKREKEKNGDLLRQYNRLELAYQSTQDRFKKLEQHLEQVARVSDRVLLVESQVRDLQQRLKQLVAKQESAKGSLPMLEQDVMALRRCLTDLKNISKLDINIPAPTKKSETSSAAKRPSPSPFDSIDLEDTQHNLGVFLPQSSSLRPNSEAEPLDSVWTEGKTASQSNPKNPEPPALPPWPQAMSEHLKQWLEDRYLWDHQDWLELLRLLADKGFSEFIQPENYAALGKYLEQNRP